MTSSVGAAAGTGTVGFGSVGRGTVGGAGTGLDVGVVSPAAVVADATVVAEGELETPESSPHAATSSTADAAARRGSLRIRNTVSVRSVAAASGLDPFRR